MSMKYNYAGVDSTTLTFGQICSSLMQNNSDLMGLEKNLKDCFISSGKADDAAAAWHSQIDMLIGKVEDFQNKLTKLNNTIQETVTDMSVTDQDQGRRFLEVRI